MNPKDPIARALQVMVTTPHIRAYLELIDPKALEQAQTALGLEGYGPLPDLNYARVVRVALAEYAASHTNGASAADRQRAGTMRTRIEAGFVPLAAREARINAEEAEREARKARFTDDDADGAFEEAEP